MCRAFDSTGIKLSTLGPGEASPQTVETFIVKLFTELQLYTCCERLYFYFTCHASPGALWIDGQRLSNSELAKMLSTPGNTYVPSRVYVHIDSGYGWLCTHCDDSGKQTCERCRGSGRVVIMVPSD